MMCNTQIFHGEQIVWTIPQSPNSPYNAQKLVRSYTFYTCSESVLELVMLKKS